MPKRNNAARHEKTQQQPSKSAWQIKRGKQAYQKGKKSEMLALWLLRLKGYRILARRWRCPCGEIDVIARKGKIIALVEIKARPDMRQAMEAVGKAQQKRIEAAADLWLAQQKDYAALTLRFDFIAVIPRKFPRHIKAYWTV